MGIIDVQVHGNVPPFGDIVRGSDLTAYRIPIFSIFVGIDQYRLAYRVDAAVLVPHHHVRRVFVITGYQQRIAMREGLHIRQLEGIGELRHEIRITAGDIQRIRIVRVRDQLEEAGPVDLTGGAELQLLVMLQLLAEEQGREQGRGIAIMEMLSRIQ